MRLGKGLLEDEADDQLKLTNVSRIDSGRILFSRLCTLRFS